MNEHKCPYCEELVDESFNVCPYCGEPLNDLAKSLFQKKDTNAQLKLLVALAGKIKDPNALRIINVAINSIRPR